jgi:hypothetical protein
MIVSHRVTTIIYTNVIVTHGLQYGNACSVLHYRQHRSYTVKHYIILLKGFFFLAVALRPNAGHGLILEVSRSHTTTHRSR